jgi:predicted nucleic acid-binding protein
MKSGAAVADAGPLHYLALIKRADVLGELFERILIPEAVRAELLHVNAPPDAKSLMFAPPSWIQFRSVQDSTKLATRVQRGEAEAVRLAIENQIEIVLIDDSEGRKLTRQHGLIPIGTVGILELAAARDLLALPETIRALRRISIFLAEPILEGALRRDRARKGL